MLSRDAFIFGSSNLQILSSLGIFNFFTAPSADWTVHMPFSQNNWACSLKPHGYGELEALSLSWLFQTRVGPEIKTENMETVSRLFNNLQKEG